MVSGTIYLKSDKQHIYKKVGKQQMHPNYLQTVYPYNPTKYYLTFGLNRNGALVVRLLSTAPPCAQPSQATRACIKWGPPPHIPLTGTQRARLPDCRRLLPDCRSVQEEIWLSLYMALIHATSSRSTSLWTQTTYACQVHAYRNKNSKSLRRLLLYGLGTFLCTSI